MITMYKYQFEFAKEVTIEMPDGPTMLSVQLQNGVPSMWAMVNTDNAPKSYKLACYWTGEEITNADQLRFIGTVQAADNLVWHIFEQYI